MGYRLIRRLARLLLGLFYRRVEVAGADRIPAAGPLIVAANHQNALVDPALLLTAIPRRLRPIAKAPLFRYPVLGTLLRLTGAIPVHRRQDPGSDPPANAAMFEAATATLREGGAILIFPEGVSQAEPRLLPLRTGAARMALAAAAAGAAPALVPVGLVFHEPARFRAGWALVLVGDPLVPEDRPAGPDGITEAAVRRLTERLGEALRQLVVEARDRRLLRLAEIAERLRRAEAGSPDGVEAQAAWLRGAMRAYRYLDAHEPARLRALMHGVEVYARDIEAAGLATGLLPGSYPPAVVIRYGLREGLSLLLGLPLAAWGVAVHGLPYQGMRLAVGLLRPGPDAEATYKILGGVVLYPLAWLLEGWVVWRLAGPLGLLVFAASLVPAGFFALAWGDRWARVRRDTRGWLHFLRRRDLHARLRERRWALVAELEALAARVPASVLAGTDRGAD